MSSPPPQGVAMQKHGLQTARALTEAHGIGARAELLERALRACASVGIFTESADGRFGPTPLSEVLKIDTPASVRRSVEADRRTLVAALRRDARRAPAKA